MGKKRKQKDKKGYKGTNEERKTHYKIRRFNNALRRGKTVAEIITRQLAAWAPPPAQTASIYRA